MNLMPTSEENHLFFFLIFLLIPLFFLLKHVFSKKPPLPPGPFPWPIIGNVFQMGDGTQPLYAIFAHLTRTYGPLMSLRLGTKIAIIASSPTAAREILKTHDRFLSGRYVSEVTPIFYPFTMAFSTDCSEQWRYLRTICKSGLFSAKVTEAQGGLREKKVMELLGFLGSKEGEVVDLGRAVYVTVTNMISNALFSVDFLDFEGKGIGEELRDLISSVDELGLINLSDIFCVVTGLDVKGLQKKKMKILEKSVSVWENIIEERRKQGTHCDPLQKDFLDNLIETGFNDGQINQLILELLIAGTDTGNIVIEWTMAELVKTEEAMRQLKDELDTKIGKDQMVKDSHLAHLPYLQACVKESMRLHPPGPLLLPHMAVETRQVMGFTVPKDSLVFVNIWAMGHDPSIWKNPLNFEPQRFVENELDFMGNNLEFVPFGAGRRICPGQPFAVRQVLMVVASLVHHFNWFLPYNEDPSELDMTESFTINMRKKVPLKFIPKLKSLS